MKTGASAFLRRYAPSVCREVARRWHDLLAQSRCASARESLRWPSSFGSFVAVRTLAFGEIGDVVGVRTDEIDDLLADRLFVIRILAATDEDKRSVGGQKCRRLLDLVTFCYGLAFSGECEPIAAA